MFHPMLFSTLKNYTAKTFRADLLAGITVSVVALPLSMAFAIACNFPPEKGLVTAMIAGFCISFFGGSKFQIGGPTGAFIVIICSITAAHGYGGLLTATLLAGIFLIIMGALKFGALIKFIPLPVITGFTSGIAVVIFLTQLKEVFGLAIALPAELLPKLKMLFFNLSSTNFHAVVLCFITVIVIIICRRFFPKIPAMLIGMLTGTLISVLFNFDVVTIGSRFGELSATLPVFTLAEINFNFDELAGLINPAITIALLAGIESLLSATVADGMTGEKHRPNTELIAQGIANIGAVCFSGIPATGAIARTATNIKSGAQTPMAGIIHAIALLFIVLLFAPYAKLVPLSALAGIMVIICYNMSEYRTFLRMFKGPKSDYGVMLITFILTVSVDLVVAVEVGVILSALLFIRRVAELVEVKNIIGEIGDTVIVTPKDDPDAIVNKNIPAGVVVYELAGPLFYGAVERFKSDIFSVFDRAAKILLLRMRNVSAVDASALNILDSFVEQCRHRHLPVVFSGVREQPRAALAKYGITKKVGDHNVCDNIDVALIRVNEILQARRA